MKRLFQQLVAQYRLYASAPRLHDKVADLELALSVCRLRADALGQERDWERRRANAAESLVGVVRAVIETTPKNTPTGVRKEGDCK
jgi:hypothetical protein